jgi:hypothetical protein
MGMQGDDALQFLTVVGLEVAAENVRRFNVGLSYLVVDDFPLHVDGMAGPVGTPPF